MQTFLPYRDFIQTAKCLDSRRLGKQRVETLQILNTLLRKSVGWQNHPATRMWRGYEPALCSYGIVICTEWQQRGFKDTVLDTLFDLILPSTEKMPPWLSDYRLSSSHRASLLRKEPEWYKQFGWTDFWYGYFWPVSKDNR